LGVILGEEAKRCDLACGHVPKSAADRGAVGWSSEKEVFHDCCSGGQGHFGGPGLRHRDSASVVAILRVSGH